MAAHVRQAFRERAPQLDAVCGRDCIAQRALHLPLCLEDCSDSGLHVAEVVERIEDAKDVDSAFGGVLDEQLDGVVREVAVRDEVLAADQRLDGSVRRRFRQLSHVLPRVLAAADLSLEGRAAEGLHGGEADVVHHGGDRDDLVPG